MFVSRNAVPERSLSAIDATFSDAPVNHLGDKQDPQGVSLTGFAFLKIAVIEAITPFGGYLVSTGYLNC